MAKWDSDDFVRAYMSRFAIGFQGLRRHIETGMLRGQKAEYALRFIEQQLETEEVRQRDLDNQMSLRQTLAAEEAVREASKANERADQANRIAIGSCIFSVIAALGTIWQAYGASIAR